MSLPTVRAPESTRRRGVVRISADALSAPNVRALDAEAFCCLVHVWAHVARFGDNGTISRDELLEAAPGELTEAVLARLVAFDLLDEDLDGDGREVVIVERWLELRPRDLTAAERKRRERARRYGQDFYGTVGDVMEVHPELTRAEVDTLRERYESLQRGYADADEEPDPRELERRLTDFLARVVLDETRADYVRGAVARLPGSTVEELLDRHDGDGNALGLVATLHEEIASRGRA